MDERVFNDLSGRLETIETKAVRMHRDQADLRLKKWLDNQEVCETLAISKRTLQSYRETGLLPYSIIRHKIFYKPDDVQKLLDAAHHSQK
jgi:hypothetical protein